MLLRPLGIFSLQATIPAQPANYAPLLGNARVYEVGPRRTKILCVTHVQGRLSLLCNLIQNVGAACVINAGNFGFFGALPVWPIRSKMRN